MLPSSLKVEINKIETTTYIQNICYKMPEGPECHYTAYRLNSRLKDKTLVRIEIISGRYEKHGPPEGFNELQEEIKTTDVVIKGVRAKGKLIYFLLSNHKVILSTLGLKGEWC